MIDLIIMGAQMPEMDGFEATRFIREMEAARIYVALEELSCATETV